MSHFTAFQILTVDDVNDIHQAPNVVMFAVDGTWTKPASEGFTGVRIRVVGGGGGGGGATGGSGQSMAGSGGGGGYAEKMIPAASLGATETVTVGVAGSGGAAGNNAGGAGGTSSFGTHASATGGAGGDGEGNSGTNAAAVGGNGGAGSSGDINANGEDGTAGRVLSGLLVGLGTSGSSVFGGGRKVPVFAAAGLAGSAPGAGGSGATASGTSFAGGDGAAGIVIVEEFF